MITIYDYLKMDHKNVSKLFQLFKTAISNENKFEIFELIKKELVLHAESESATFYQKLIENPQTRKDILHAEKEHNDIIEALEEISALAFGKEIIDIKMEELNKLVEHHVKEEEGKIFDLAKKILSDEEAWILKEKMHDYKEKLLHAESTKEPIPELA